MLLGLQTFANGYRKLVKQFAEGLTKCSANFEKDMFHVMRSTFCKPIALRSTHKRVSSETSEREKGNLSGGKEWKFYAKSAFSLD